LNDEDSVSHRIFHPSSTVKCSVWPGPVPVNVISKTEVFSGFSVAALLISKKLKASNRIMMMHAFLGFC
jgi:hypothetical protein